MEACNVFPLFFWLSFAQRAEFLLRTACSSFRARPRRRQTPLTTPSWWNSGQWLMCVFDNKWQLELFSHKYNTRKLNAVWVWSLLLCACLTESFFFSLLPSRVWSWRQTMFPCFSLWLHTDGGWCACYPHQLSRPTGTCLPLHPLPLEPCISVKKKQNPTIFVL